MPTTSRAFRLGAIVAVVMGIALLAWLVLGGDDDEGGQADEPQAVSIEDLQEEAGSSQVPIFWAGPLAGTTYEFTVTSDGSVYVPLPPRGRRHRRPQPRLPDGGHLPAKERLRPRAGGRRGGGGQDRGAPERRAWRWSTPTAPPACTSRTRASPTRSRSTTRRRTGALDLVTSGAVQPVR